MPTIKKNKEVDTYINALEPERAGAITKLRDIFLKNLSADMQECIQYKMISYVVPHSVYPDGYHCTPALPLPFISLASQKNFIAIYHMGIYADEKLLNWFVTEFPKHSNVKLDMGKSCIRFKKMESIPYTLIEILATKMSSKEWIALYEKNYKR